jgi:uncharacterized membrane protein
MNSQNTFLQEYQVPEGLVSRVMSAVERAQEKQANRRFLVSSVSAAVSTCLMVLSAVWLYIDALHTGLAQSLSLAFSDTAVLTMYWHDFLGAVFETLPFLSLVTCLASISVVLMSLRFFFRSRSEARRLHFLHSHSASVSA